MFKKIVLGSLILLSVSNQIFAQNKKNSKAVKPNASNTQKSLQKTPSGVEYVFYQDDPNQKVITEGSVVKMHIRTVIADSTMFDTYKMNNNEPIEQPMSKQFIGAFWEGFTLCGPGDSVMLQLPIDSAFKGAGGFPPFAKSGDKVKWYLKIFSVKTKEEADADRLKSSKVQNDIDDKLIREYIKKNNLKTLKTNSGIYYIITKTGNGKHAVATDKVKVHYKGYKMDGTQFDSSYDRNQPVDFPLSGVIKGWTEGIPLFEEGGKGTLLIPSSLAYGTNPPPGANIKANEVLLFDVELLEILK